MNSFYLLAAITDIDSSHILAAQEKLGYHEGTQPPCRRISLKRALILAAVVALLVSLGIGTALALSSQFRGRVFRFLHIDEPQVIPQAPVSSGLAPDDMIAEPEITLGPGLTAKYVHTPVAAQATGGVFLVCTDPVEMKQGSRYDAYYEENGEFVQLEEFTFRRSYTLRGTTFHLAFQWAQHRGNVVITWADADQKFIISGQSGDASAVLLRLVFSREDDAGNYFEDYYPVLLNLYTGEMTDVLAGTGAEALTGLSNAAISGDMTKMLLEQSTPEGYRLHYADLEAKKLYSLDALSGEHVDDCSLMGNTLACWNLADGFYKAWHIDLATFQRSELFGPVTNAAATAEASSGIVFLMGFGSWVRQGSLYLGSRFALVVDDAQQVYATDLQSGEKLPIPGYTWKAGSALIPSPDGTKLLLAGGPAGGYYESIGILDFEKGTFAAFSREHLGNVQENQAYWFDENTVVIHPAPTPDSLCSDFYLYSLEEHP